MATTFEGQRQDEEVVYVFRRHILTSIKGFFFLVFMAVVGFAPILIWPDNQSMVFVWMGFVILGLLGLGYSYLLWYFSFYIITNQRLRQTRQKGLFKKTVVDLSLENIQSASFGVPGMFGSMFNYGTILIQTGAGDLVLSMVSHPETVYNEIENARHDAQPKE
ncbi:MAG: PH domain-containing protein [Candidatus Saccharibacteria bacterium]|nr:PH domain-containing protein [Candidatus Saccharibacteria bacterium]